MSINDRTEPEDYRRHINALINALRGIKVKLEAEGHICLHANCAYCGIVLGIHNTIRDGNCPPYAPEPVS